MSLRWQMVAALLLLTLFPVGSGIAAEPNDPDGQIVEPNVGKDKGPDKGPAKNGDRFALPDGGPQELMTFIEGLTKEPPGDPEHQAKIREAVLKAANKIMASKPTEQQFQFAVKVKGLVLQDPAELAAFAEELKQAGHAAAARMIHVRELIVRLSGARDVATLTKQIDEVKKFLAEGPLQPGDEALAVAALGAAEQSGNDQFAAETCEGMAKLLSAQPAFAPIVRQMQAVARRLRLVGNEMQLEGKTLDGKALDWAGLRGKVVLIDFWATWCGPCRAEVPNIKENYKKYHEKGFEVVGISLDQMASSQLAEFVKKEEVPWIICRDADSPKSMAEYYGIMGIPAMILVGRDGKVVTLNARGPALGPAVEKALAAAGDVAEDTGEKPAGKTAKKPGGKPAAEDQADSKQLEEERKAEERAEAKKKREEAAKARAAKARDWTDASGKFHVVATFRGLSNKNVKLETDDGRVLTVPLEKLSDDDQEYVRRRR